MIISIEDFLKLEIKGKVVATCGGFDPIHPGHISCIQESKKFGQILVVIVNGDSFLEKKKGKPFQDLDTRCYIVDSLKLVDYVIPFEIKDDQTCIKALDAIKPDYFTKGGDRVDEKTIPEWEVCQKNGTQIITGVGLDKEWSSSDFLSDWVEFKTKK